MRWIRIGWRPLAGALAFVLLIAAVAAAAPAIRPDHGTVLHELAARWAPEKLGEDECDLVAADQVGRLIDTEARLTERALRPSGDGWQVRCGYGDGRLGLATASVTLTTDVTPASWEPYRRESEPAPVRLDRGGTVGDETFLSLGYGPANTTAVRLETRAGRIAVRLEYFAPVGDSGGVPNPAPGLDLLSAALRKAGGPAYQPGELPSKAYAGCQRVDLEAAAELLGEELATARTTTEPSDGRAGDLHCGFAGEHADLRVTVWHSMDAQAYLQPLGPNLQGVGDAGAFDATVFPDGQARMQAAVRIGDSIISVDAGYADHDDVDRRKPTDAERELLESIVRVLS